MITSLQNPLIKQLRKLQRSQERKAQQLFLLEGTHLLQEAIATHQTLATLCSTPEWQDNYPQLWQHASASAERTETVSHEVLKALVTTVNPDGVVATLPYRHHSSVVMQTLGLALETLQDPGNLGTIIRTAAAARAEGLLLSADSVDPENPKVLRASAGQWFRVPIDVCLNLQQRVEVAKTQGLQVIATQATASQTYWEVDWRLPSLILLGNEGAGLSSELIALSDVQVQIPLSPGVESLNVSIAAALLLYEARRQRDTAGIAQS
jgi:RNA methyltransferase, TrmH family